MTYQKPQVGDHYYWGIRGREWPGHLVVLKVGLGRVVYDRVNPATGCSYPADNYGDNRETSTEQFMHNVVTGWWVPVLPPHLQVEDGL